MPLTYRGRVGVLWRFAEPGWPTTNTVAVGRVLRVVFPDWAGGASRGVGAVTESGE